MFNWTDMIGKRILVFLSPTTRYAVDVVVTKYEDGKVYFDNTNVGYDENVLDFVQVFE
jgi:hypothetical protein